MRYKSNNKSVQKGLNKTWVLIGIPFFSLMIGTFLFGFCLLGKYEISGAYPLVVIFGGIFIPGIICHQISKLWFAWQLKKVTDKVEFISRAKRLQLIWPATADKIALKQGVFQTERKDNVKETFSDLFVEKGLTLTNDFIVLKGKKYSWKEIKDYRITATGYGSYPSSNLMLIFKDNRFVREVFQFKNGTEVDYQLDKYLNKNK